MSLTTSLSTLVQRTGASGGLSTTGSERAAFVRALQHDLSGLIGQLNTVYKPLVERLVSEMGLDALEAGLVGNVVLTDGDAVASSAPAYWHAGKARPRTLKETVDVLLSDLSRLENALGRSGGADLQAIRSFIGMATPTDVPNYSDHGSVTVVADGDSLEVAVQKLDEAVSTGGGGSATRIQQVSYTDMLNLTLNSDAIDKAQTGTERFYASHMFGMGPLQFSTGTPFLWIVSTDTAWNTNDLSPFAWSTFSTANQWAPDISFGQLTTGGAGVVPVSYAWDLTSVENKELTGKWIGSTYFTDVERTAEGAYYLEFLITAGEDADFRLGVIDRTVARPENTGLESSMAPLLLGGDYPFFAPLSYTPPTHVGTAYSSKGAAYDDGFLSVGTYPPVTLAGDVVGMLLKFTGLETASAFSNGSYSAKVYFSLNGTWMNGADPDANTGGIEVGNEVGQRWVAGVSLAHENCAKATIEVTDYSLINDGDYFMVGDKVLAAGVNYTGWVDVGSAVLTSAHLRITEDPLGAATLHTLTGAVAEDASLNEFVGNTSDADVKSASIVAVINNPLSTIGASGFITATRENLGSGIWRVHFVSSSFVPVKAFTTTGSDGSWQNNSPVAYGSFEAITSNDYTVESIYDTLRNLNPVGQRNPFAEVIRYVRPEDLASETNTLILYHEGDNTAGNGVTCSFTGTGAVAVDFAGGTVDPVIQLVTSGFAFPPSFDYLPWSSGDRRGDDTLVPLYFPNPFAGGSPTPFNISIETEGAQPENFLYGRGMQVVSQGGYDGGNVRVKFLRADTLVEEERTVLPAPVVDIDVPIARVLEVEVAGAFTTGSVALIANDSWLPPGIPASLVAGVAVPSPIWVGEGQAPTLYVADEMAGYSRVENVGVSGEDGNMLDVAWLTSNGIGPNAAMSRCYFGWSGWVEVTSDI